ncbi:MAG TPA: dockerin, partial [Polyangiaceae bacterium]|nr:dockerin [Polyangiaceae bacterium]
MMVRLSRLGLTLWVAALSGCGNGGSSDKGSSSAGSGGTTGGTAASGGALSGSGGSAGAAGTGAGAGGKAGMAGSAGNGGAGGLPTSEKPFDWVGVIGTGQSLSVGWESTAISTTQPFKNVTLLDEGPDPKYPIDSSGSPSWSTVPLIEPIRIAVAGTGAGYDDWQYPNNIAHNGETYGETPHSGMANTLSALWQARGGEGDYITAHSVVGWSGHGIVDIDKTGGKRAYLASLAEANVFNALAAAEGKTYGVGGIVLTHGENDANNPVYGAALYQLWQDYNADLKAITGQAQDVILFGSQQSSSAPGYDSSAVQLWRAGVDHPGQIVCTGPKYQYRPYGLHLPGPGYERLGEKYGEVF